MYEGLGAASGSILRGMFPARPRHHLEFLGSTAARNCNPGSWNRIPPGKAPEKADRVVGKDGENPGHP